MSEEYFISRNGIVDGPFDLLSMIRKIKNGRVTPETMVAPDSSTAAVPAAKIQLLHEILTEHEIAIQDSTKDVGAGFTLFGALRNGWEGFQINPNTALVTGLFAAIILFGVTIISLSVQGVLQGVLCSVWSFYIFNFYLVSLSRKSRMQLLHGDFYGWLVKKKWQSLLGAALISSLIPGIIPALLYPLLGNVAIALIFIPGALSIAYFMFLPLVIVDRGIGLREALSINAHHLKSAGLDFYTVIFGLVATNIIIPLFPVTLPITLSAACDMYDKAYNDY
ncbi:MAG: DUF4339 domain-containing protein [Rickettsiales bacterium]|nr:DUF4339 domain-containing protein [Rickettsiales bacterium]